MKYICIILLSFFLALPAYAAKTVKGTVPVVDPLQPPAAGINFNASNNIQAQDPDHPLSPQTTQDAQTTAPDNAATSASSAALKTRPKSYAFVWLVLILAALAGGYWFVRRGR